MAAGDSQRKGGGAVRLAADRGNGKGLIRLGDGDGWLGIDARVVGVEYLDNGVAHRERIELIV
ncbi:hypothetical protein DSECCO2_654780 [anaerobic digester metagenome]